ncbi:ring-1,2-phenylacetyl-CoA epoxidase subunit PaaC [Tibeticola sediminis]|uniref:Ring-1,2-phenylacetyl-CoA epoxidase subunit PaaC n=1 Tax=Tibeticola sediminis TaxID=1917811 RepID=A0A3N4V471_9BURK|nr:1,2-phenylacetyl-CoA epoxidase subunit PaaC [Tibeticola sediminis]RPE67764.1 ring-1,2-phenylacetyl-CoA epoxidase subunit PaaC [Tibeticola sediminis]
MDAALATTTATAPVDYLLHLADNALVLGQRNAEWCGHGPVIEEDLSMANNSLDLIGEARLLYQLAADRINGDAAESARFAHLRGARVDGAVTEDTLAYFRDTAEFRNYTLLELPHSPPRAATHAALRDYATTIVRNFLYSALMLGVWDRLARGADPALAGIAARAVKEVQYHYRHARDWLVRFGDGTAESHARAQVAIDHLMPYTEEFWSPSEAEAAARRAGTGVDGVALRGEWEARVDDALLEATLQRPAPHQGYVTEGKHGRHSEHLGFLLAEMQSLARAHPDARW